jgi:hypothetical protein
MGEYFGSSLWKTNFNQTVLINSVTTTIFPTSTPLIGPPVSTTPRQWWMVFRALVSSAFNKKRWMVIFLFTKWQMIFEML